MKIGIAQFYTSNVAYAKYSEAINRRYCENNGYEYFVETDTPKIKENLQGRSPTWYKPKFLLELLETKYLDYVLFMDIDAIVANETHRIEDFIRPSYDVVVTQDYGPSKMNAGVILLKNTPWTKQFLKDWWQVGEQYPKYKEGLWHDQTCFGLYMDATPDWGNHIKIIDNRILNSNEYNKRAFIFHAFCFGLQRNRTLDTIYYEKMKVAGIPVEPPLLVVVYHVYCTGNWKSIVSQQLNRLHRSGLYEAANILCVTINDPNKEFDPEIFSVYPKFSIVHRSDNHYEYPGIKRVYDLAKEHENMKVLYFHAKGVSNTYKKLGSKEVSVMKTKNISAWRECLEYFVIDRWKDCVRKLDSHDSVGVTCINGWFWGNFWWSQSSHLRRREEPSEGLTRWGYEAWLSDGTPSSNHEFYHFSFNPYISTLHPWLYDGSVDLSREKMELISARYGTIDMQLDEGYRGDYPLVTCDVSPVLRKNLEEFGHRGFDIRADNIVMGQDPAYGYRKFLVVDVKLRGEVFTLGAAEGQSLEFHL